MTVTAPANVPAKMQWYVQPSGGGIEMKTAKLRTATSLRVVLLMIAASICFDARAQESAEGGHRWLACDVSWLISAPRSTGPNFTVRVSFHKKPIPSVRLLLGSKESGPDEQGRRIVATSETDSSGVARFFAIPSGKYEARIEGGLLAPSEEIEVDADSVGTAEIMYEWPGKAVAVRNLRGLLTASGKPNSKPLPLAHVLVQLLDLRTSKFLGRTYTNSDGYYDLSFAGPGLYVVRFNEGQDLSSPTDDMAVEVRPHAIDERMPELEMDEVCGTGLSPVRQQPDQVLFERSLAAVEEGRFDVAKMTIQTLINTYPHSEYASKAELLLQDPRIPPCGESWNSSPQCDGSGATKLPTPDARSQLEFLKW